MSTELKMPALSPTMEKGTLAKWLVNVGDVVRAGDLIAEIETDKATMEFEAVSDGRLSEILIPDGTEDVVVGTTIAMFVSADEAVDGATSVDVAFAPVQADRAPAKVAHLDTAPTPVAAPPASKILVPLPASAFADDVSISATPLARRIAFSKGIALTGLTGTGPRGRIVKADLGLAPVKAVQVAPAVAASPLAAVVHAPPAGVPLETVKLSGMRKTIARRLTEAKQTVPHFYLTVHCNLNSLLKLRSTLNDSLVARGGRLSVNDLLLKAMALAMVREPDVNVQYAGDEMHRFNRVDISMAVAIDGGLITPVIRDAANLALSAISDQSKALAAKARDGRLTPEEYQGGTASISNLGMFGIDEMFPVINPPQALIMGIGAGLEKPWKIDGAIALATMMTVTASFDHRAIDGATAARFMASFRDLVEAPMQILC